MISARAFWSRSTAKMCRMSEACPSRAAKAARMASQACSGPPTPLKAVLMENSLMRRAMHS
eukprot:7302339-Alexandrium_andersonii.AAC.1